MSYSHKTQNRWCQFYFSPQNMFHSLPSVLSSILALHGSEEIVSIDIARRWSRNIVRLLRIWPIRIRNISSAYWGVVIRVSRGISLRLVRRSFNSWGASCEGSVEAWAASWHGFVSFWANTFEGHVHFWIISLKWSAAILQKVSGELLFCMWCWHGMSSVHFWWFVRKCPSLCCWCISVETSGELTWRATTVWDKCLSKWRWRKRAALARYISRHSWSLSSSASLCSSLPCFDYYLLLLDWQTDWTLVCSTPEFGIFHWI